MSALRAALDPSRRRTDGVAPLLALFTIPVLTVVMIISLVASGDSWGLLAAAIAAVVALLAVVMVSIWGLLGDDEG